MRHRPRRHATDLALGVACLTGVLIVGCRGEVASSPHRAPSDTSRASGGATAKDAAAAPGERAGLADYRQAGDAVASGDVRRAIALLEHAVALDPEFAEAWYQLGAARSNLAVAEVGVDEPGAVQLFRDAVEAKQRARSLMLLGKTSLWNDAELAQAEADADQALSDVDDVLVDDAHVAAALRLYGGAGGS